MSAALAAQDCQLSGGLKMVALVPGGASGVLLKLNSPFKISNADSFELILKVQKKLRLIIPCSTSWHQREMGIFSLQVHRPAMKCCFQV